MYQQGQVGPTNNIQLRYWLAQCSSQLKAAEVITEKPYLHFRIGSLNCRRTSFSLTSFEASPPGLSAE
jgi:hypothetical protein